MATSHDVPGSIESIYDVDGIVIVEYVHSETGEMQCALYVDNEPAGVDFADIDVALLYAVLYRYESEDALPWIAAMIGMGDDE